MPVGPRPSALRRRIAAGVSAGLISACVTGALLPANARAADVDAAGAVIAPAGRPLDTLAERVQVCTVCHGKEGRATSHGYFPRIAGKPAGYLHNQLVNFRDGRRNNAAMAHLVALLTDDYLREIAGYFGLLELPYPPPQTTNAPPAVLARGEELVRRGDAALGVPACSRCHGEAMTGVVPSVPGLLGLPRDYLVSQFGAWTTGERRAAAPDCMARIAQKLSREDIGAVATWLSAQPVPRDARPAARIELPLPMECGSGPKP